MPSAAIDYARQNSPRFLDELKTLLRIPSISTLPEHNADVFGAATWLGEELKRIGMENVEVIKTAGHPLVYADWLHAAGKPTCLATGITMCSRPIRSTSGSRRPSSRRMRDGNLYARGAVDDKGQMYMHMKALESLFQANGGKLPINVRVLDRGEEEVGGEQIAKFVREKGDRAQGGLRAGLRHGVVRAGYADALRGAARAGLHGD